MITNGLSFTVPPNVSLNNQLVGSPIGERVTLNCRVEAYPAAITYWMRKRDNGKDEMLMNGPEFSIQEQKFEFRTEISLVIDNFDREDVGVYTCTATNSFGTKESKARLYGKSVSKTCTIQFHIINWQYFGI